jgi:folate-binding protein YgfZ
MQTGAILNDRALVTLTGPQAKELLQGLVTNDLDTLQEDGALYAALLTPQGKILFDFIIVLTGDRLWLDCAKAQRPELIKRLKLYRLRAKVEIAESHLAVGAVWGDAPLPGLPQDVIVFDDPRLSALGKRVFAPRDVLERFLPDSGSSYHAMRIALGVPDSTDIPSDTVFALDAGFEELHAVSFRKGCYVGQEVTARMKHRTSARKRFLIAEAERPYPFGTAITAAGREIGTLASHSDTVALALVRLDRLPEAGKDSVAMEIEGRPIVLRKPEWLLL